MHTVFQNTMKKLWDLIREAILFDQIDNLLRLPYHRHHLLVKIHFRYGFPCVELQTWHRKWVNIMTEGEQGKPLPGANTAFVRVYIFISKPSSEGIA